MMLLSKGRILQSLSKKKQGTKFSPVYKMKIGGGATKTIYCRLNNKLVDQSISKSVSKKYFKERKQEANDFYAAILPKGMSNGMAQDTKTGVGRYSYGANNIIILMWSNG